MKFKNIYKLILSSAIIITGMASCDLDPQVYDKLPPDKALNTEADVKAAVTGIYSDLLSGGWKGYTCAWGSFLTMQVGCTDEVDCNWLWEPQMDFQWTADNKDMSIFYNDMTPAITRTTSLIHNLANVQIAAKKKRGYIAELRCLRAMWAYDLYDLYGTVPIVVDGELASNTEKLNNYQPERPTVEWYVNFVETELTEAMEDLKDASDLSKNEYGRMTTGIARMYLLKLYMHEAGQERHYRNNEGKAMEWWKKVEEITKPANWGDYTLMTDYSSIWAPNNQQNKEVIFPVPCFAQGGLGNTFLAHALPADYVSEQGIALTAWGGFLVPWAFYDTYDQSDKRRERIMTTYWNGKKMVDRRTEYNGKPGAIPMKYQENANTTGQWDASDYVINRYAEVVYARVEALNELDRLAEAKQELHKVLYRAFNNYNTSAHKASIDAITSKDAFRDRILDERGWEFCWEGMRRPDLIRHGKLISNAHARGKMDAQSRHILYAIPQTARYENPNLGQNPGFN